MDKVPNFHRFQLLRHQDVTGISGTGVVAEGILFSTGKVVISWLGERSSVVVWNNLEDAVAIHGHQGSTEIVWIDE